MFIFFFSSRRRHTRSLRDWSSDVCSSDLKITNNNIDPTSVKVTYTPQKDYVGDDSFTFKVNDGKVDSNIAKVSINVNSINGAVVLPSSSSSSAPNTTSSSSIITAPISNNNNSNTNKAHLG